MDERVSVDNSRDSSESSVGKGGGVDARTNSVDGVEESRKFLNMGGKSFLVGPMELPGGSVGGVCGC